MNVEQLIEKLQELPPDSQVLVEGAADTLWGVKTVTDDESGTAAILLVGAEVTVRSDD
jgi:hypothetical protein